MNREMKKSCLACFLAMGIILFWGIDQARVQTPPEKLLLKDYRPKSIYKVPTTYIQKAKYPVIDIHSHPYAKTSEEIAQWVKNMDEVGIEKTIILTQTVGATFDSIYAEYAKYPGRFEVWCGFDYTGYDKPGFGPAAVAELERCVRVGAKGVGELGDKGKGLFYCPTKAWGMHPDDPRMDPLFEKCAELGLPVSLHVADPIWMYEPMDSTNDGLMNALEWRLDNQPDIVGHAGMIDILERTIKRHPKTIFIACHFANLSYNLTKLGELFDKYPNLYADISARYAETAPIPRFVAKFYEKYQARLLYGTDMGFDTDMYRITFRILESTDEHFYEIDQFGYHWALNGFGLSDKILKKVYRDNALKVLK
ncbi:MAG: amidohydrolase [candidate division KSB1 bacterium]|nr:amidohydrolase [candidate division KSB1 bacterium]